MRCVHGRGKRDPHVLPSLWVPQTNDTNMKLEIEEDERLLIILALATLEERSPGFDYALNKIALKFDQSVRVPIGPPGPFQTFDTRAAMYDGFRGHRWSRFGLESADQLVLALRNVMRVIV